MKSVKKKTKVKVCPNCGSTNVTVRGMIGNAFNNVNYCKSCGFQSVFFLEVSQEEAKKIPWKPPNFIPSRAPIIPQQRWGTKDIKKLIVLIGLIVLIITFFLLVSG